MADIVVPSEQSSPPTNVKPDNFQFPFAAAPDIIRSNQKDTYFQGVVLEQLSTILRNLYGARFVHNNTSGLHTFADLLYLGLTTLVGNRTLGEEYCDIVQVEDDTLGLPDIYRRGGYILGTILVPYSLSRILPAFRRRIREKLEYNLHRISRQQYSKKTPSFSTRLQSYILSNLDMITSPSPVYAASLAVFYFSGAYYHIGKRLFGLRYIFTKKIGPSEQRVGYEVLGVLLILQITVQGWLHIHQTLQGNAPVAANAPSAAGGSAIIEGGVEVSLDPNVYDENNELLLESNAPYGATGLERSTHTPALSEPRYNLIDNELMQWMHAKQQRKCTLCLEELKDPSATTCGHVFCWSCIQDWIKEKPECPLCRQSIMGQHVLPLRG